jgi:pullulanase
MLSVRMPEAPHRIVHAWLDSLTSGIIELDRDWTAKRHPRFTLGKQCPAPGGLVPAPGMAAVRTYGYYLNGQGQISFGLPLERGCEIDPQRDRVFLAGDFNGWDKAVGDEAWEMRPAVLDGERLLLWSGDAPRFLAAAGQRFKFVTGEFQWLLPPGEAPNAVRDAQGNTNRLLDPARTGWHLWRFTVAQPLNLAENCTVAWAEGTTAAARDNPPVPLVPGDFFYELGSELPLGAIVRGEETLFRIFAPRAKSVRVNITPESGAEVQEFTLHRREDADGAAGIWETNLNRNLHGWLYWYAIDGSPEGTRPGAFDPALHILDPYALAAVDRGGPGLVLDRQWVGKGDTSFRPPAWNDLVIVEAHVRDLAAQAPVRMTPEERLGFTGLRRWVESPDFHLHRLGVNCVELQPLHEFDNVTREEYHWGYMTNSFFAPESSYALEPAKASGVRELQELVAAFHQRGMAVILDVVYNHVGVPAHLMAVDRRYYFEQDATGALTNWSGCGNDLRARSAMARRLIIDSCRHMMEVYGIDGFRFDLAELLGVDVLRGIEAALKRTRPEVILIAEPWSFRGHIAGALRDTGWASWNDGYRDFVRDYVRGNGGADRLEYFLRGSPWYFAKWPAQTVNYTESHDDRTWIDMITENPNFDGSSPTANDRRRTHLMAAILFMSIGIPMLSAGQDFLRSKRGVNNTYQRGDLNALDYRRVRRFLSTHVYFADWIAFRRGELGRLLRLWSRPNEGFFRFFPGEGSPALAVVYNADGSQGGERLLFAVNPTLNDATIALGAEIAGEKPEDWVQLADQDRFYPTDHRRATLPVEPALYLPPLGCGLWVGGVPGP